MTYYFNELDPTRFQRLVNTVLVARFGERVRLMPLRGSDGGRDAEAEVERWSCEVPPLPELASFMAPPEPGFYFFQAKHHDTRTRNIASVRRTVLQEFTSELSANILPKIDPAVRTHFILITNVPSSSHVIASLDRKRRTLRAEHPNLSADVWWEADLTARLDQFPQALATFPDLFPGGRLPSLVRIAANMDGSSSAAVRAALAADYALDRLVKFRQIDLEKQLATLFSPVDVAVVYDLVYEMRPGLNTRWRDDGNVHYTSSPMLVARALDLLLNDGAPRRVLLEGGPGQGKSTLTQMLAQVYRQQLLRRTDFLPEGRWPALSVPRIPLRVECRSVAEAISRGSTLEQYLASYIATRSGGAAYTVDDLHELVQSSNVTIILDGLDEVGGDDLRDQVVSAIAVAAERLDEVCDRTVRIIVTTRPPALAGRREKLVDFTRTPLVPLDDVRVTEYVERWCNMQAPDADERARIKNAFAARRQDAHVAALAANPMQLAVLLHFIRLKGEAFPDRRAELYREYFQIVIDRDVEKSSALRETRELVEDLHKFLGYEIHAGTEARTIDGTLERSALLTLTKEWLGRRGASKITPTDIFRLGEERLGLIVTVRGEGSSTYYGYEIQPIREYFAASYINDQILGNAHDIFEEMIRRPFWREVALFLAGLRRLNERADLFARCRSADGDAANGWRQDGRAVVLRLALEGVLTQPAYLYDAAVDYLLDAFDLRNAPLMRPFGFAKDVAIVARKTSSKRIRDRVGMLLQNAMESADGELVYGLLTIARDVLGDKTAAGFVMKYKPLSERLRIEARTLWSARLGLNLVSMLKEPGFFDGGAPEMWALGLARTLPYTRVGREFNVPVELEYPLAAAYAAGPIQWDRGLPAAPGDWTSHATSALVLRRLIASLWSADIVLPRRYWRASHDSRGFPIGESQGLDELIEAVGTFLAARPKAAVAAYTAAVNNVKRLVERSGITSMLAMRTLLALAFTRRADGFGTEVRELRRDTIEMLRSYFVGIGYGHQDDGPSDELLFREPQGVIYTAPGCVATSSGIQPLETLYLAHIETGAELPYEWMLWVPVDSDVSRGLLYRCTRLKQCVRFLADRAADGYQFYARRHIVRSLFAELKRENNLDDALRMLWLLQCSDTLGAVGTRWGLRVIETDVGGQYASAVFLSKEMGPDSLRTSSLAEMIVKDAARFAPAYVARALQFMAENSPVAADPLKNLESQYQLCLP